MGHMYGERNFRSVAEKIVHSCARVQPGEVVQLGGGIHNFDLLAALAVAVRRMGAFPELNVTSDELQWEMMTTVPVEHLRTVPPHRLRWLEDVDVMIVTDALADPSRAADVPEDRRRAAHAAAQVVERRIFEQGMRWVYVGYPTPASLKGLAVPFDQVWDMFWRAVDVDYDQLAAEAAAVAAMIDDADEIRITTAKGTDISIQLGGRPVLVDDGIISDADVEHGDAAVTLPAGKVFVAPLESTARGRLVVDFAFHGDRALYDLELTVDEGRVELVGARQGADDFGRVLEYARGNKDRIGELGIGLNPGVDRWTGLALADEKRRGTVYLGLGDNRLLGGDNAATMHWDLFLERPTVLVDGQLLIDEGELHVG